jgi:hypothetical protein
MRFTRSDDPGSQAWPKPGVAMDGWTPAGHWPTASMPRPMGPHWGAATATECLVDESAAQVIRQLGGQPPHGAGEEAVARICLLDPSRLWASQVVHALAHLHGSQPERLDLRERGSLRTLAVIERTRTAALATRGLGDDGTPPVLVSSLAYGLDQLANVVAMAECSHLSAVVVGAMRSHALDNLLQALLSASRSPMWRCPQLLFILPPAAAELEHGILAQPWPAKLRITVVAEAPDSPQAAWQCVLDAWWGVTATDLALSAPGPAQAHPPSPWRHLASLDGVRASALVRLADGHLIEQWPDAGEGHAEAADLVHDAQVLCQSLLAHQLSAYRPERAWGKGQAPEEILVSHGSSQVMLRRIPGQPTLAWVARLDADLVNLTTIRRLLSATGLY